MATEQSNHIKTCVKIKFLKLSKHFFLKTKQNRFFTKFTNEYIRFNKARLSSLRRYITNNKSNFSPVREKLLFNFFPKMKMRA